MSKICCVGDADICPKTSSCSMVLRSACSHSRHSRESSTASKKSRAGTPHKSKHISSAVQEDSFKETSHIGSVLESSLKQLAALKFAKSTYSLLKGYHYNSYELSENVQRIVETDAVSSCAKKLHFSHLSASSDLELNGSINHKESEGSNYSGVVNPDMHFNALLNSTSKMSRTRFTRSSISSMRSLSGSEGEDEISVQKLTKKAKSDINSNYGLSRKPVLNEGSLNIYQISNNHVNYTEMPSDLNSRISSHTGTTESDNQSQLTDSSSLDRSSVQHSSFDRFRWFLWRFNYLQIIRNVNFDVWFLCWLHNHGKKRAIFFFLLPLLLYIMWDIVHQKPFSYEALNSTSISGTLYSVISSIHLFFSSLLSSLYTPKEELHAVYNTDEKCFSDSSKILSFFTSLSSISWLSGRFATTSESAHTGNEVKYPFTSSKESIHKSSEKEIKIGSLATDEVRYVPLSKEEIRLLAVEVLRDEISLLKDLHVSDDQRAQAEKLEKEKKVQNEIKNLKLEFKSLSGNIEKLEKDILQLNEKSQAADQVITMTNDYKRDIDHLNLKLRTIETKLGALDGLKTCCDKQLSESDLVVLLEKHLVGAFKNIIDGDSTQYRFFNDWLNSKFFSREVLMQEINAALRKHSAHRETDINHDFVMKVVETTVLKHVESIKKNLTDSNSGSSFSLDHDIFSEDKIKKIVKEAIMLYDADKTGQVDYALESGGGSVLGTRCTETYSEKYGKFSIFGVPLWTNSNSPRTAIQPDMHPGRCWGFKGSQGFLVLELSATIYPTGFTLEHIPVSLSPTGLIDSAPKNFSVWGLSSEIDNKGNLLGEYLYDINADPLQYFAVQKPSVIPYNYIELQMHSNHGNMEYTCLYRFRVHGRRV